ncbi:MAG: class I SAM-dependent methyltransferase [Phycisphaerales bacterium]|nr:class I SAM-dependent methyltransferase [bacterium]
MSEQDLSLVPGKENYTARYVRGGRLFSYAHQMNAVLEHEPRTVLEIGPGPGMVTAALQAIDVEVTTVDIQAELKPDVVASVTNLPFEDDSFDVSMCCQVLEHLPFDRFVPAIKELSRVSRHAILISLPDPRPYYEINASLFRKKTLAFSFTRPYTCKASYLERVKELAGHYWEVGSPGIDAKKIASLISSAELHIRAHWRCRDRPYHHFFDISPRGSS